MVKIFRVSSDDQTSLNAGFSPKVSITASGLCQRFTQEAATFMQRLLERLSEVQMQAEAVDVPLLRRKSRVIDETLERRWGRKISKRGHWRDSLLSSKEHSVSTSGLPWVTMALVVSLPWTKLRWALPFLSVLATVRRRL